MSTPLNPDAIRVATTAAHDAVDWQMYDVTKFDLEDSVDVATIAAVSAYLAVAQPVVNSVEELDKLPIGSLIMMSGVVAPFLHTDDGWESTRTPGKPVWDYTTNPSYLPARVLYRPEVPGA